MVRESAPEPALLPRAQGYRMPAEWEPHAATWLTWPRRNGISFPERYDPIPAVWARMVAELAPGEEVHINTFNEEHRKEIKGALAKANIAELLDQRVFLHDFPAYEPWCRDHGPIFVRSEKGLAVVDWIYNAWGGKYPPFDKDDDVARQVAEWLGVTRFTPPMVLEGGSIDVDGRGTLLTTESCLLHPNRNPQLAQSQIESFLCEYLGVDVVLWLGDGIAGDDTDGHIDDITRFVGRAKVVTCVEDDPEDDNYAVLQANRELLEGMKTADGESLEVIEFPMPGPIEIEGDRLPASYANFYIGNEVVLVPVFGDPNDEKACEILQNCFPQRRVVGIDANDLIWGLGAFHCVTQQQPVSP